MRPVYLHRGALSSSAPHHGVLTSVVAAADGRVLVAVRVDVTHVAQLRVGHPGRQADAARRVRMMKTVAVTTVKWCQGEGPIGPQCQFQFVHQAEPARGELTQSHQALRTGNCNCASGPTHWCTGGLTCERRHGPTQRRRWIRPSSSNSLQTVWHTTRSCCSANAWILRMRLQLERWLLQCESRQRVRSGTARTAENHSYIPSVVEVSLSLSTTTKVKPAIACKAHRHVYPWSRQTLSDLRR